MPSIPLDLLDPEFLPEPLVTEPSVAPPAVADTGTSWEAIAARLEQEVEAAAVLALTGEPDFGSVLALVDSAFEVHEAYLAEAVFTPPMACAKGCHHCCFNPVSLSPVEALHLGAFIEDHFTPDHLDRVRQRLDPVLTVLRGKTRQEMSQQRHLLLCPLVMEGACAGHPARPLVCRGWNSIDPEPCRLSVERREPMMDIENHELPRLLADSIQLGLLRGTRTLGMEAGFLALPRALWLLLEYGVEECASRWLRQEPFFGLRKEW